MDGIGRDNNHNLTPNDMTPRLKAILERRKAQADTPVQTAEVAVAEPVEDSPASTLILTDFDLDYRDRFSDFF